MACVDDLDITWSQFRQEESLVKRQELAVCLVAQLASRQLNSRLLTRVADCINTGMPQDKAAVTSLLEELNESLTEAFYQQDDRLYHQTMLLRRLTIRYRQVAAELETGTALLEKVRAVEAQNLKLYRLHIASDQQLAEHMERGSEDEEMPAVCKTLVEQSRKTALELEYFDELLARAIRAREEITQNIRRLNRTDV